MSRMIFHPELFNDQARHPAAGPDRAVQAKRSGALGQKVGQGRELRSRQSARPPTGRVVWQPLNGLAGPALEQLAHDRWRYAQNCDDATLFPSLLVQGPGAQAPTLAPTAPL
jgi:hypothetical protein